MKPQDEIISQLKDGYGIEEDSTIAISIRLAFEKLQKENEELRSMLKKQVKSKDVEEFFCEACERLPTRCYIHDK